MQINRKRGKCDRRESERQARMKRDERESQYILLDTCESRLNTVCLK